MLIDIPDKRQDSSPSQSLAAEALNRVASCIRLDRDALRRHLDAGPGSRELYAMTLQRCPHLFAAAPVFVTPAHAEQMRQLIGAVEAVAGLPRYRAAVLGAAPPIARSPVQQARGVFFGYDFHVGERGVSLIEINTNAGGAMLNAALAGAQLACCPVIGKLFPMLGVGREAERAILDMFREEWRLVRGARALRSIAIVDVQPQQQYLYPEFLLFQRLFRRQGWEVVIADPSELRFDEGVLRYGRLEIDLVYNRLTDFMLEQPENAALRAAYLQQAVVVTPHPQAYALYANKRNLALLSDAEQLRALEVPPALQRILLEGIPHTEIVNQDNAARLWEARKTLFFKPLTGYGGRAAYRGDKLTARVWQQITAGEYVAQTIAPPGERLVGDGGNAQYLKFDVRNYVYDGAVQSVAARLYQGQTTNFRTPGGGFSAVFSCAKISDENP